jgi:hypothetical protein
MCQRARLGDEQFAELFTNVAVNLFTKYFNHYA